jgi:hydrogenase 3 maturation protease
LTLEEDLRAFLGSDAGRRVALVGIGSPIRSDDRVGLRVLELLEGKKLRDTLLISAETVPESYTGAIRDYNPTHMIMVDAAHFRGAPGEGRLIPTQQIQGTAVSTHSLPLHIFADYIRNTVCGNVALLGIQGVNIDFGESITPEVENGALKVAQVLEKVLGA